MSPLSVRLNEVRWGLSASPGSLGGDDVGGVGCFELCLACLSWGWRVNTAWSGERASKTRDALIIPSFIALPGSKESKQCKIAQVGALKTTEFLP